MPSTSTSTDPPPSTQPSSSSSSSSSSTTTTTPSSTDTTAQQDQIIHYTCITTLLLCPLLIALPPRKFDIYTIMLLSSTGLAGNQLAREYSGQSLVQRIREAVRREERDGAAERTGTGDSIVDRRLMGRGDGKRGLADWKADERVAMVNAEGRGAGMDGATVAAVRRLEREKAEGERRKEDWTALRDAREKEALEDGRGYGDLIMDQIWEVWNWGRDSKGDGEGKGGGKS